MMYPLLPIRPISDHHLGFESQSYTLYGYSYTQLNILLVRLLNNRSKGAGYTTKIPYCTY